VGLSSVGALVLMLMRQQAEEDVMIDRTLPQMFTRGVAVQPEHERVNLLTTLK